jgi:hypothetical protein
MWSSEADVSPSSSQPASSQLIASVAAEARKCEWLHFSWHAPASCQADGFFLP